MNEKIIFNLKSLYDYNKSKKEIWKSKAYSEAIKKIESSNIDVRVVDDLKSFKFGKSINEKLVFIIENNQNLPELESINATSKAISLLTYVHNIGPSKATQLVNDHNILTIEDLRKNTHLLNDKEKSGLKYHEHIIQRIPRDEMELHDKFIKHIIYSNCTNVHVEIAGSYRRNVESSGDIDVIIASESNVNTTSKLIPTIIEAMKYSNYICSDGIYAYGKTKAIPFALNLILVFDCFYLK